MDFSISYSNDQPSESVMNHGLDQNYDFRTDAASDTYSKNAQSSLANSVDYMTHKADVSLYLGNLVIDLEIDGI